MNTFQFIGSMTGSLAWPLAAVLLGLIFKRPVADLFDRVRRLSWGDKAADLAEGQQEVEESAAEVASPLPDDEREREEEQHRRIEKLTRDAVRLGHALGKDTDKVPDVHVTWQEGQPFLTVDNRRFYGELSLRLLRAARQNPGHAAAWQDPEVRRQLRHEKRMADVDLDFNAEGAAEVASER